jgi:hypothetical protein
VAWPPRNPSLAASFTLGGPFGPSRARPPSTRPVATGRHASLDPGVACRLLQPDTTRGHTLRAFDPRTRVRLSPRYTPAPTDAGCVGPSVRCRTGSLRAAACTRRLAYDVFHCRGRDRLRAEALEQRRAARSWTISRVPFSWRLGHPGRRIDSRWSLEGFAARRPDRGPPRMPPREGRHRRKDRGAFCRAGTLTRAEDGSSVRA